MSNDLLIEQFDIARTHDFRYMISLVNSNVKSRISYFESGISILAFADKLANFLYMFIYFDYTHST